MIAKYCDGCKTIAPADKIQDFRDYWYGKRVELCEDCHKKATELSNELQRKTEYARSEFLNEYNTEMKKLGIDIDEDRGV